MFRSPSRDQCGTHLSLDTPNVVNPSCYAFAQMNAPPYGDFLQPTALLFVALQGATATVPSPFQAEEGGTYGGTGLW